MTLTEWRKLRDLTMAQAAAMLDLTQPTISKIEAGKSWPDKSTLERIFQLTEGAVTPNDFLLAGIESKAAETAALSQ